MTVDPADSNHIVEANADPINLQCDYHVSFDGGKTWAGDHLKLPSGSPSPGAPPFPSPACDQNFDSGGYGHFNAGVIFGTGQNVYITFSIHRGDFNRPEGNSDGGDGDDAVVARSTDGGKTFAPAVIAVPGGGPTSANPGLAGIGMRPQIAVQKGAGTGGADRLYVSSWNCYIRIRASQTGRGGCSGGGGDRRIWMTRSNDGGSTWNAPVLASAAGVRAGGGSPLTGAAAEAGSADEQAVEPSQPIVGPDGAVYVAYKNRDITDGTTCPVNPDITTPTPAPGSFTRNKAFCVVVARSTDNGVTWTQASTAQPVNSGTLVNPRLAIDPTVGATGKLYVVYQRRVLASEPTAADIFAQSSTDGGQTWSSAVRVNNDAFGNIQTNPWVSVGSGGVVNVIWHDRRHNYPGGGKIGDIYSARSTDGGATFSNRRVTDRSINTDVGRYNDFGEDFSPGFDWYGPTMLPLPGGNMLASWTDSRTGNFDNGFQKIFLSRLDPAAEIAKSTTATASPSGLSVMLSRLAYPGGQEAIGAANGGVPITKLVVANEGDVAGALAGAVLARANWGSLLLSPAAGLPTVVKADAIRMRPEGGFVIG
ncbi:MAG: glycoside hydrolase, partial [Actinomycetota bacterium]|nr:glycoside hydrolase [Actinomycetota bacterium]